MSTTAVKNPNPHFTESNPAPLKFIADLVARCRTISFVRTAAAALIRAQTGSRQKAHYKDRAAAMNALMCVFAYHIDIVTWQCRISLTNAAKLAGLVTTSKSGVNSISRASRAFSNLVDIGLIAAPKSWQTFNREAGEWTDKYFEVTELFFEVLGCRKQAIRQRDSRLNFEKRMAFDGGVSPEEIAQMTITQMKERGRIAWRKMSLKRRRDRAAVKKLTKTAKKTEAELQKQAHDNVLKTLTSDTLHRMSYPQFAELVNKEVVFLLKQAKYADSPPT